MPRTSYLYRTTIDFTSAGAALLRTIDAPPSFISALLPYLFPTVLTVDIIPSPLSDRARFRQRLGSTYLPG